jgi:hypothetical protein
MQISDSDVFRMAKLLFAQNGVAAVSLSAKIANEAARIGDTDKEYVWRRIAQSLCKLIVVK